MSYQEPKSRDYGINLCEGCLHKQREIDRLKEENQRLKQKLNLNQRKSQEGFFGSSTRSSKVPVKASSLAENQAQKGGGQVGQRGVGRQVFKADEADEQRIAEVSALVCLTCQCRLHRISLNERAIYEKSERLHQWCQSALIPAENNYAEREIRKIVIARKMSCGSQSQEGAKTREIWTSVLQSLKKRAENPRDKLVKSLNKLSQNENLDIAEELFSCPNN